MKEPLHRDRDLYEQELRRNNQIARENASAANGLLIGILLASIAAVIAALFFFNRTETQAPQPQAPDVNVTVPAPEAPEIEVPDVQPPDVNIEVPEVQTPQVPTGSEAAPDSGSTQTDPAQPPAQ